MISKGTHRARATGGEFGESKKKGTPHVHLSFRIEGGEHDGERIAWDGYFTDNTTTRTMESLRHCGCTFPNDNITDLTGVDSELVEIVVEHEAWTDENSGETKERARVAWVNSPGGLSEDVIMDDAKKRSFAQRMKGAIVASKKKAAASPNAAPKPANGQRAGAAPRQQEGGYEPEESDDPFR